MLHAFCVGSLLVASIDSRPPAPGPAHVPAAAALVEEFSSLMRVVHLYKAQSTQRSARSLLFPLGHHGPVRTTALAELVHTDTSTTSRQVAELVAEGLAERTGDPADRRASLVGLTAAGRAAIAAMRAERADQFAVALADWSPQEISTFAGDVRRFHQALAAAVLTPCAGPPAPAASSASSEADAPQPRSQSTQES